MARAVTEWVGKTADTKIPDRVKLRVFLKYGGKCYLSGIVIRSGMEWDAEHIIALVNWNASPEAPHGNRESNLAPALRDKHKEKSRRDVAEKSMVATKRKKDILPKTRKGGRRLGQMPPGYRWDWSQRRAVKA